MIPTMSPKILLLSVSAGAGHVRAAQAVQAAARARGFEAEHIDVMDLVPKLFRKLYAESFIFMVNRNPALWGYLYHSSDRAKPDGTLAKLRRIIERVNTRKLAGAIADAAPTHIISTHFLPSQLVGRMKAKDRLSQPLWTVVTDFDVHALWVQSNQDGFCVAADEIGWRLRDRLKALPDADDATRATPIRDTGIPIAPGFSQPLDRAACARELGIDPAKITFLLMSGGLGVGAIDQLAARILAVPGDFQVVAMAGKNQELLTNLTRLGAAHPGRLQAVGFTTTPERLMAVADLAITKPGGLTTSECLALGLPLLVVSPIPGQEERNSDFLLEHGAALKAHDGAGVEYRIRQLLADPGRIATLKRNARALGKPAAAKAVLDQVLES